LDTVGKVDHDLIAFFDPQIGQSTGEALAQVTRVQAEADKVKEILKGEGEAGRIEAMAKVMNDPNARFVATLDVAETVLPKANVIVMPSDLGVIGGILKLGQEVVTKEKPASKD